MLALARIMCAYIHTQNGTAILARASFESTICFPLACVLDRSGFNPHAWSLTRCSQRRLSDLCWWVLHLLCRPSADPLIACWLASFDSCPPPVLPFFPDMLSCLSPGTQQLTPALFSGVLQQVEPAPLHLGPHAQIHFNLLSRLCNIPFALTAKIHLFRWAI